LNLEGQNTKRLREKANVFHTFTTCVVTPVHKNPSSW
jgi:hypothetical protein